MFQPYQNTPTPAKPASTPDPRTHANNQPSPPRPSASLRPLRFPFPPNPKDAPSSRTEDHSFKAHLPRTHPPVFLSSSVSSVLSVVSLNFADDHLFLYLVLSHEPTPSASQRFPFLPDSRHLVHSPQQSRFSRKIYKRSFFLLTYFSNLIYC